MNRLFTTPTRNLIRFAIFHQTEPPRWVDCLAPLWDCKRKVSFPRTQQRVISSVVIDRATLRLLFGALTD